MGLTPSLLESLTKTVTQDVSYANPDVWFSLHSANPGATGLHEVTSGTGAAGRQQVTFAGSGGSDHTVSAVSIALTAETVTWVGYWTAQTGGTFLGGFPLVGNGVLATGVNTTSQIQAPNHGRAVNDPVRLFPAPGGAASAVPAPFVPGTVYYVKTVVDSNTLVLSATMGGAAILPSSNGGFNLFLDRSLFSATGTLTFPAGTGIVYVTTS